MIAGLGLDLCECARLAEAMAHGGEAFRNRVFTPREISDGAARSDAATFFAGRWAAKEALAKALGCGIGKHCSLTEVEVTDDPETGAPRLHLSGRAAETAARLGAVNLHLSITHEKQTAAAVVILEK